MTDSPADAATAETAGPHDFPSEWTADVLAADGGVVHLRPIVPADADRLVRFHSGLSARTRYLRYFGPYPTLPPREIARMTTVDHRSRVAFVAILGGEIIAMGIYEGLDSMGRPESAEVAFVVSDDHQGRGLGPILLEHLAGAAAERGFTRFEADVLAENPTMIAVFRDAGYQVSRSFEGTTVHVEFTIDPTDAMRLVRDARERASEARSVANLLRPSSVAVIGASSDPRKVGNAVLANVVNAGFTGPVYPVNAESRAIRGIRAYPSLRDIPDPVDLAVIAVPAGIVDSVLADCLAKGVKTLLVVSAGFAEVGEQGRESERRLLDHIREHGMRLVGPNALGVINTDPLIALNATLAPRVPERGTVGFFCQSGALGIAILDSAARRQLGLSTFVSAGNRADVSGNDVLQYWDQDPDTEVVLLYLESFGNPRKFSRIARRVARTKPIVAVKSGRTAIAPAHAASDAALADRTVNRLFAQAGVIQVDTLTALFDCATVLAYQPLPSGPRVSIVGNSTALGGLAENAGERFGLTVVDRVDLGPGASPDEFHHAVRAAVSSTEIDAVVAVFVPPVAVTADLYARALMSAAAGQGKPVVSTFLAAEGIPEGLMVRNDAGAAGRGSIPSYPGPERAAEALGHAWRYARWRATPDSPFYSPSGPVDRESARTLIRELTMPDEARTLTDHDAAAVLACYGVHIEKFVEVRTADAAVEAANAVGYPVAIKATSDAWRRRIDQEGVRLDLTDDSSVRLAFHDISALSGDSTLHVQTMAPRGIPVVITVRDDSSFGSVLSFGLGGIVNELLDDRGYRTVPLTVADTHDIIDAPRSAPLLTGYRGQPAVDRDALADVVGRISAMVDDIPEIREVSVDPILCGPNGIHPLSVQIRIGPEPTKMVDAGPRRLR